MSNEKVVYCAECGRNEEDLKLNGVSLAFDNNHCKTCFMHLVNLSVDKVNGLNESKTH